MTFEFWKYLNSYSKYVSAGFLVMLDYTISEDIKRAKCRCLVAVLSLTGTMNSSLSAMKNRLRFMILVALVVAVLRANPTHTNHSEEVQRRCFNEVRKAQKEREAHEANGSAMVYGEIIERNNTGRRDDFEIYWTDDMERLCSRTGNPK